MFVDEALHNARMNVCAQCEYRKLGLLGYRCRICHCFIRPKTKLAGQSCPVGLWPAVSKRTR